MSAKDELRALVEQLDDEAAAEVLAYGRWLLTEGKNLTAENMLSMQRRVAYHRAEMERQWAEMAVKTTMICHSEAPPPRIGRSSRQHSPAGARRPA